MNNLVKGYDLQKLYENIPDREIKKAYRTLSRKYHPDSYSDESQKNWAGRKIPRSTGSL